MDRLNAHIVLPVTYELQVLIKVEKQLNKAFDLVYHGESYLTVTKTLGVSIHKSL